MKRTRGAGADLPFEEALKQLEERVRTLEAGELTLDQATACFEAGMQLARQCESRLAEAKGKVEVLLQQADGRLVTEPLGEDPA